MTGTCKNEAILEAFEGPLVDLNLMKSLLVHLQEWTCGHTLNATDGDLELKGRIGDMIILSIVDKHV